MLPRFNHIPPPKPPVPQKVLDRQFEELSQFTIPGFGKPEADETRLLWATRDGANVADEEPNPENVKAARAAIPRLRALAPDLRIEIENVDEWTEINVLRRERSHPPYRRIVTPEEGALLAEWLAHELTKPGDPPTRVRYERLAVVSFTVWPRGSWIDSRSQRGWRQRRDYHDEIMAALRKHPDFTGKCEYYFADGTRIAVNIADYATQ